MTQAPCRIAYLIDDLSYGGAQRQLVLLAESLRAPYVPVIFCLSQRTDPYGGHLTQRGIEVIPFRRRSHFDLIRFISLVRTLARKDIDIIQGVLDASNAYAYLAGRILHKPTVLSLRSERLRTGPMKARIVCHMYRRCHKILTNSKAGEKYLLNTAGVAKSKIALVRNLFPMDAIAPAGSEPYGDTATRGDEIIGYVGRLSKQKNIDLVIQAFCKIAPGRPKAKLVIIGDGDQRAPLQRLIDDSHLAERIVIREPVSDILGEMRQFKCLALPSANEGLPNVVIESLAVGTPVIGSAVGDVAELVIDGQTGVLLREPQVDTIAAAMSRVLSDGEIARSTQREGPRIVRENFSVETVIGKYLALYDSLAG
ncbi:MAG: glycosyltransferase [Candidatus Latescibacterota bacterium]